MRRWLTALALAAAAGVAGAALAADSGTVPFPTGYRSWFVDHSTVMLPGHTPEREVGIAQVYANAKALKGLKTGKFADGAVFVIDRFQISEGDNKVLSQGERKALVVMLRDHTRKDTGGWGFEAFVGGDPKQRVVSDGGKACFTCHAPLASNNFLFTHFHP